MGGSSLVRAEDPFIHVTNITSTRIRVQGGDIMGILRDPKMYLDNPPWNARLSRKPLRYSCKSLPGDLHPKRKSCPNLSYPQIN